MLISRNLMITKAFKQPNSDTTKKLTSDITRNYRDIILTNIIPKDNIAHLLFTH